MPEFIRKDLWIKFNNFLFVFFAEVNFNIPYKILNSVYTKYRSEDTIKTKHYYLNIMIGYSYFRKCWDNNLKHISIAISVVPFCDHFKITMPLDTHKGTPLVIVGVKLFDIIRIVTYLGCRCNRTWRQLLKS